MYMDIVWLVYLKISIYILVWSSKVNKPANQNSREIETKQHPLPVPQEAEANLCDDPISVTLQSNLTSSFVIGRGMSFQDVQNGGGGKGKKASASQSQAVAAGIFQINTAVATFRRLVDAIGTVKDTPDHRQKLHSTRQRILELVKDTSAKLKSLSESDRHSNVNPRKQIEDAKLARDFQTTLQEFQKVQQLASERESTYMPSLPATSASASASASGEYLEPSRDESRQPFLREQKRQEVVLLDNEIGFNEAIIEEREQGIKDIEEQIGEASEIFRDLAVLVHEQGVVIDDIHSNIDNSSAATTQARVQLAKASKGVKTRSSWCWWVLAIVVVVIVIVLIILII